MFSDLPTAERLSPDRNKRTMMKPKHIEMNLKY
jgi:hypothetical protein